MLPEDQKRILGYFIEEAKDHLNTIEQGLLNLNATIHDTEMANEVFRAAHSVKGGAAMLGINSMQRTAHRMEDFFKVMKESPLTPDQTLESMLLQIFDGLQEQLEHLQSPYGLTEEQGQVILANLEPIFAQTEAHLTSIAATTAPTAAPVTAPAAPVTAPAAKAASHPETSALQLVFRSDIPELLREMLATFKQADGESSRQQLAQICQRLYSLGEQLELPQWCQLAQTVGQAAGNRDETYRSLAPIIIKDLKQAQDQVLAGQVSQVAASAALLALLPPLPSTLEDDSALDALLAEALTDSRDGEDLADLFATAEADPSANLGLESDDSWLEQITDTDATTFDDAGLESVFSDFDGVAETVGSASGFSGQHHPGIGPQVGPDELNTLADLFEGEQIGLGDIWEEDPAGEGEVGDLSPDLGADDIDSEFADLFQTGDAAAPEDLDDDMVSLFGNALEIDLTADDGTEDGGPLAEPEPPRTDPDSATAAPETPAFDAELFDSADAAPVSPPPGPEVDDFFDTVAPVHPQAEGIATDVDDFFADLPSAPARSAPPAVVQGSSSAAPQPPTATSSTPLAPSVPTSAIPEPVAAVAEDSAAPSPAGSPATPVDVPRAAAPVESELDLLFDQLDQDLTGDVDPDTTDLTQSLTQDVTAAETDPFALADDLELAFGDADPQPTSNDLGIGFGEATLTDDLGLDFDLGHDPDADLDFEGDLAPADLSSNDDLSLDLDFTLDADTFPPADAVSGEAEGEAITDPFGGIDLDSLDLLTEETDLASEVDLGTDFGADFGADVASDLEASAAEPPPSPAPAQEEPEDNWLTELDDLVMDMPPAPGAIANGSASNGSASNGSASNGSVATDALDLDDFSDLEALLEDDGPPPAPPVSAPPRSPAPAIADEDSFDDLEKLLEGADQLGGSAPSVVGRRGAGVASGRAPRRAAAVTDQTMRVSVSHLDNLNNLMGELVVNRNSLEQDQEQLRQSLDNLLNQVQQLNDVGQRMRDLYERSLLESSLMANRQAFALGGSGGRGGGNDSGSHATGATFDALEMDRFTGFHTLSQEMIELIVRVREASSDIEMTVDSTDQIARQFRQVTTQLQEGLNKARMVPFGQTADRLPRAVRDISIKCGKEAKLVVEGRDTLVDKMILERLYDPMTHLVNNAITHGIETPEERLAAGKVREGMITVRAFYQGNQTVIYIADNGGGINPAIVKAKALTKGLITAAEAQTMSDIEVYDLLFEPGFSTRDQADDFSGRGVGMDVVRTALADIRGSITIESEVGKGTSFTIRLPLTLSITKALSCINNQARIAFPIDGVEDMFDVPKARVQTDDQGHTSILWRDTLLPLRPLGDLLKFNRILGRGRVYGGSHDEDMMSIVVLRSANSFIGLQVDQVIGEQEIVIKQLEGPVPKPTGIAGATVLGDGRVMPIADVLELIDMATGRVRREAPTSLWNQPEIEEPEDTTVHTEPTVLIVDDSITVRELLSMSFNKVGYRVEQARDGQEAWDKLRSGLPCDLVFCDIEMPRMDGLELLSRLQKDEILSQIPIAMLTSRGADRHRQMAVELGAKGYFTKPYLEEMLLDAAQRMLKGETMISLKES